MLICMYREQYTDSAYTLCLWILWWLFFCFVLSFKEEMKLKKGEKILYLTLSDK